jgi:hypothetical protein
MLQQSKRHTSMICRMRSSMSPRNCWMLPMVSPKLSTCLAKLSWFCGSQQSYQTPYTTIVDLSSDLGVPNHAEHLDH